MKAFISFFVLLILASLVCADSSQLGDFVPNGFTPSSTPFHSKSSFIDVEVSNFPCEAADEEKFTGSLTITGIALRDMFEIYSLERITTSKHGTKSATKLALSSFKKDGQSNEFQIDFSKPSDDIVSCVRTIHFRFDVDSDKDIVGPGEFTSKFISTASKTEYTAPAISLTRSPALSFSPSVSMTKVKSSSGDKRSFTFAYKKLEVDLSSVSHSALVIADGTGSYRFTSAVDKFICTWNDVDITGTLKNEELHFDFTPIKTVYKKGETLSIACSEVLIEVLQDDKYSQFWIARAIPRTEPDNFQVATDYIRGSNRADNVAKWIIIVIVICIIVAILAFIGLFCCIRRCCCSPSRGRRTINSDYHQLPA